MENGHSQTDEGMKWATVKRNPKSQDNKTPIFRQQSKHVILSTRVARAILAVELVDVETNKHEVIQWIRLKLNGDLHRANWNLKQILSINAKKIRNAQSIRMNSPERTELNPMVFSNWNVTFSSTMIPKIKEQNEEKDGPKKFLTFSNENGRLYANVCVKVNQAIKQSEREIERKGRKLSTPLIRVFFAWVNEMRRWLRCFKKATRGGERWMTRN